jgi:FMN reductase
MVSRRIAVISAGLGKPSSTRLLADRLTEATVERLGLADIDPMVEVIELRDIARDITNNLLTGFPSPKLAAVIDSVSRADGLIALTPIFTASYSGLFKSFFDVLDNTALAGLPVLIGATGGTARHSLALDFAVRPMFAYLHAVVVPTAVFAATADWGSGADAGSMTDGAKDLPARILKAAGEFADLVAVSERSTQVRDPFKLSDSFSPVGSYGGE